MAFPLNNVFGAFGSHRRSFETSNFVSWFSMVADDEVREQFRPSGAAFHALVCLDMIVDNRDAIRSLHLSISQQMLADPAQEPFARDIAKSFLLDLGEGNDRELAQIAQEIMHRDLPSPMLMRGEAPLFDKPSTMAFRAFTGEIPSHSIDLLGLRITLERIGDLSITAERLAVPRRSFLSRLRDKLFRR